MSASIALTLEYAALADGVMGSPYTHAVPAGREVSAGNLARSFCGRTVEVARVYRAAVAVGEPMAATSSDEQVRMDEEGRVIGDSPCCLSCSKAVDRAAKVVYAPGVEPETTGHAHEETEMTQPDVSDTACPACGVKALAIETRLEAKPTGTYSLAGAQTKVAAVEWPWLMCGSCGAEARGKR